MLSFLNRLQKKLRSQSKPTAPRSQRQFLPELELLESRLTPSASVLNNSWTAAPRQIAADFNNDSRDDIAVYRGTGVFAVFLAKDNDRFASPVKWSDRAVTASYFFAGDFDGDQRPDIASVKSNGAWWVHLGRADHFEVAYWGNSLPVSSWATMVVGDYNGDGLADLAGLTRSGQLWVGVSDGVGFRFAPWGSLSGAWTSLAPGDVNNDGQDDLIAVRASGAALVLRSDGSHFTQLASTTDIGALLPSTIRIGDFNADGRADIAALDSSRNWLVGVSHGDGFTFANWGSGWNRSWSRFFVGDHNGDQIDDIALYASDGGWWLALSDGQRFGQVKSVRWSPPSQFLSIKHGDFDGDGQTDFAGRSRNGTWFVATTDGGTTTTTTWYYPYSGEFPPYLAEAPWNPSFARQFVTSIPSATHRRLFFNSSARFQEFVYDYRGMLRRWYNTAKNQGILQLEDFKTYLRGKLDEHFQQMRGVLEKRYAGLSDTDYRLLMAMNLTHGHFRYGTVYSHKLNVMQLISRSTGDCTEYAELVYELARLMGISATIKSVGWNYSTSLGQFVASHMMVIANGLWIDPEINLAFRVDLAKLRATDPISRLALVLNSGKVYGFYNYLIYPPIRSEQLARGVDGGVIAFYYYYYLRGMYQGNFVFYTVPR